MSIEWDALFARPAIRSLVQLVQRSNGVRVNFLDERGWLQGIEAGRFFNPTNQLLAVLSASAAGFRTGHDTDFRMAATNRGLKQMIKRGTFLKDLCYRLRFILVNLSSLRAGREDISLLVRHFIGRHAESGTASVLSEDTSEYLTRPAD